MSGDTFEDPPAADQPDGQQSLDIGALLSEGFDSLTSVTGAQIVAVLSLAGLLSAVLWQSLARWVIEWILRNAESRDLSDPEIQRGLEQVEQQVGASGFGLDIPLPAIIAGLVALTLLIEAAHIAGARAFAHGEFDGVPGELARRRLPIATLYGFVGGILLSIAVGLGLILLIVPGVIIAVATVFFRQEIAIRDEGIVGAISGTWSLTKGNRWTLFGLLILLWLIGLIVGVVGSVVPGLAGTVVSQVITHMMGVFSLGVMTDAYVRLRGGVEDPREATDDAWS